tara:strand:- start:1227 stop:1454 length:228 start_codon:yes stop_codon:yes gene_type:complete
MSEFFKSYSVDEIIDLANEPIDYSKFNDMQSLHHLRAEISSVLYHNKKISDSIRNTLELLVTLINNEMDKSRGLR